jgi:hypothetical protein
MKIRLCTEWCVTSINLLVNIVFSFHQIVESSIPKIESKVVDDIDEPLPVYDLVYIPPRLINPMIRYTILHISFPTQRSTYQLTWVKLYALTLSPLLAPFT